MILKDFTSEQVVTAWLLILSGIIFLPAGLLYTGRAIWKWPSAQSRGYLFWERGLVMAAFIAAVLGLVLLDRFLEAAGDSLLSPAGLTIFLIGTVLLITAETFSLNGQEGTYVPIVASVILAFVGQAVFGASILLTGFLPGWVGWGTIIWNLAWLIILPIASPREIYYPALHFVAPLIIGIALLIR